MCSQQLLVSMVPFLLDFELLLLELLGAGLPKPVPPLGWPLALLAGEFTLAFSLVFPAWDLDVVLALDAAA
jgi:hypothetical protein